MRRPLPPLNALKAFEATARHLSFSRAAEELHVTPAALSHQIRGLEDLLALKLFHRKARAIELTAAARLMYPGVRTAFESLRTAVEQLDRARQDRILVVSASPGLTAKWLVPRIYRFLEKHPDVDTRISSSVQLFQLHHRRRRCRHPPELRRPSRPPCREALRRVRCCRCAARGCSRASTPCARRTICRTSR